MRVAFGDFRLQRVVPGVPVRPPETAQPGTELGKRPQGLRYRLREREAREGDLTLEPSCRRGAQRRVQNRDVRGIVQTESVTVQQLGAQEVVIDQSAGAR